MKLISKALIVIYATFCLAKKVDAGVLEGALIGAGIGAVIGLTMSVTVKKKDSTIARNPDSSFVADSIILPSSFTFAISEDSSSSQKIQYSYGKIFSDYDTYTKEKKIIADTVTSSIIEKALLSIGGIRSIDSSVDILIQYRQVLGWDMGEIVKRMTICTEFTGLPQDKKNITCAEFNEETMFNTHPTRKSTVHKLITLLRGNKDVEKLNPKKFHRFQVAN